MKTNPIKFNNVSSGRHLNLNQCLKEALCKEPSHDQSSQNEGNDSIHSPSFNPDLSALPCHMRVFVITALEGNEEKWPERLKRKKSDSNDELKAIIPALKFQIESYGGNKSLRNPIVIMKIQEQLQWLYPAISDEQLTLARNYMNRRKPNAEKSWKRA